MGRGRHDETRRSRTRPYDENYKPRRGGGGERREDGFYGPYFTRDGERYFTDYDGNRYFSERQGSRYEDRYGGSDRDRDREREYHYRDREQRQETKRTGMKVLGVICLALIALFGVMLVTAEDPAQQTGQVQQAPQQPAPQNAPQQAPQAPAAPEVPENPVSQEQVEGLRADIERQLVEIRQAINQLRLEIMSWFSSTQNNESEQEASP